VEEDGFTSSFPLIFHFPSVFWCSTLKYRQRINIIADILNVAGSGAKKTKIMYVANLSYQLLEKYLEETVNIGFVRFNGNGYEVTEKGRLFLEKYAQFSSRYSELKSELEIMMFEKEVLERMCELSARTASRLTSRSRRRK
jgi:predicted transcriptional regulator